MADLYQGLLTMAHLLGLYQQALVFLVGGPDRGKGAAPRPSVALLRATGLAPQRPFYRGRAASGHAGHDDLTGPPGLRRIIEINTFRQCQRLAAAQPPTAAARQSQQCVRAVLQQAGVDRGMQVEPYGIRNPAPCNAASYSSGLATALPSGSIAHGTGNWISPSPMRITS